MSVKFFYVYLDVNDVINGGLMFNFVGNSVDMGDSIVFSLGY